MSSSPSNENIFSITGQHSQASRFKLKSIIDDVTSTSSTYRLNHSLAYCKFSSFF